MREEEVSQGRTVIDGRTHGRSEHRAIGNRTPDSSEIEAQENAWVKQYRKVHRGTYAEEEVTKVGQ